MRHCSALEKAPYPKKAVNFSHFVFETLKYLPLKAIRLSGGRYLRTSLEDCLSGWRFLEWMRKFIVETHRQGDKHFLPSTTISISYPCRILLNYAVLKHNKRQGILGTRLIYKRDESVTRAIKLLTDTFTINSDSDRLTLARKVSISSCGWGSSVSYGRQTCNLQSTNNTPQVLLLLPESQFMLYIKDYGCPGRDNLKLHTWKFNKSSKSKTGWTRLVF